MQTNHTIAWAAILALATTLVPSPVTAETLPMTIAGNLLIGDHPAIGTVTMTQWKDDVMLRNSVATDAAGHFSMEAAKGIPETGLIATVDGRDFQIALRVQHSLVFDWPLDGTSKTMHLSLDLVDAATGGPADVQAILWDSLAGQYLCHTSSALPTGTPRDLPPEGKTASTCGLESSRPGHLEGDIASSVYAVRTDDPAWTMCNLDWNSARACTAYLPAEDSFVVQGTTVNASLIVRHARPADSSIQGYLRSSTGNPVPYSALKVSDGVVTVVVTTDQDGSYRIGVPAGDYTLSAEIHLCGNQAGRASVSTTHGATIHKNILLSQQAAATADPPGVGRTYTGPPTSSTADCGSSGRLLTEGAPSSARTATGEYGTPTADAAPSEISAPEELPQHGQPKFTDRMYVVDYAGGLGPLDASPVPSSHDTASGRAAVPMLGPISLGLALLAVAVVVRRRLA